MRTKFAGRHVLVVVRGYDHDDDLKALKHYIREYKPVLIGVDGGADALLEAGLQAAPDRRRHGRGLRRGARQRRRGRRARLPGRPRARAWPGSRTSASRRSRSRPRAPARTSRCCSPTRAAPSSSSRSARTPRSTSSSTRAGPAWPRPSSPGCGVGGKLVDAKGVTRLYRNRISAAALLLLVLAALIAVAAALAASDAGRTYLHSISATDWDHLVHWVQDLFS